MKTVMTLLDSIIRATDREKLTWTRTAASGNGFVTLLPDGHSIHVWKWTDPDTGISGITVRLLGHNEVTIDENSTDTFDLDFAVAERLFNTARRSCHDVGPIIEDIERVLMSL